MPTRTAEMLRRDLKIAGIPYETDSGVADFHRLRGCYISYLVSSGASVKSCQTRARTDAELDHRRLRQGFSA